MVRSRLESRISATPRTLPRFPLPAFPSNVPTNIWMVGKKDPMPTPVFPVLRARLGLPHCTEQLHPCEKDPGDRTLIYFQSSASACVISSLMGESVFYQPCLLVCVRQRSGIPVSIIGKGNNSRED